MYDPDRLSPGPDLNRSGEASILLTRLEDAHTDLSVLEHTGAFDGLIEDALERIVELEQQLSRKFGVRNNELRIHGVVGKRRLNNVLSTMKYVNTAREADESEYITPRPPAPDVKLTRQPKLWSPKDFVVHFDDLDS